MKKLRALTVVFDNELQPWEVPAFRGAVIAKVGLENLLFHQHLPDGGFINKYPLIQYKNIRHSPAIFCVEAGVDEIHKLFGQKNWEIRVGENNIVLKVDQLDLKTLTLNVWDKRFSYTISKWQALNSDNYKRYKELEGLADRLNFLEGILKANILSFAKAIEWNIEKPIDLKIKNITSEKIAKHKDIKVQVFDIEFGCNVFLPNYIGLGKGAALGFGVVREFKPKKLEV